MELTVYESENCTAAIKQALYYMSDSSLKIINYGDYGNCGNCGNYGKYAVKVKAQ